MINRTYPGGKFQIGEYGFMIIEKHYLRGVKAARCRKRRGYIPKICALLLIFFLTLTAARPALASSSDVLENAAASTSDGNSSSGPSGDTASGSATADSRKHVFVLASYELDWYAEKVMLDGISKELGNDVMLRYYFMDTKNQTTDFAVTQLQQYLQGSGLANEHFDAVIAVDDNAFDFAMQYKDRYFKGLPLVFCGVNSEKKGLAAAKDTSVTGVVETFPVRQTIEMARDLQPDAKRAVVIVDDSVSAQGTKEQYETVEKYFPDLTFRYLDSASMTDVEMQNFLKGLNEDTILILGLMAHGPDGVYYSASMASSYLAKYADIPVYKADEYGIGHGILGGCVISYQEMGERCGKMVRSILNGKRVRDIPVEKAGAHYLFDAKKMKQFHIEKSQLPAGTQYINEQTGFFRHYWLQLLIAGALGTVTMLVIIVIVTRRSRNEVAVALERERQAEKARNDFFARMSHEMRTPLNAIIGYAELGSDDNAENNPRDYFQKIDSSGKYLLSVINDVLDLGKLESNALRLHPEKVVLSEVMTGVRTIIEPLCRKNKITYTPVRNFPEHLVIKADPVRLQQVMVNLLGNAVKYTDPGGWVKFTCREVGAVRTGENLSADYEFLIEDNGIGMSEEYQKKLFTEFSREYRTDTARRQGSGLGLVITKKIVDLMGGTIAVHSVLGEGTCFTVRLTFPVVSREDADEAIVRIQEEKEQRSVSLHGVRILLAEDNELNAEIERMMLEREGLRVDHAQNGQEACELFWQSEEGGYGAILMDLMMPVCNGFEASRIIRKMPRKDAETVPILALSASVQESDRLKAQMAGMTGVLAKPIEREKLLKALEKVMK